MSQETDNQQKFEDSRFIRNDEETNKTRDQLIKDFRAGGFNPQEEVINSYFILEDKATGALVELHRLSHNSNDFLQVTGGLAIEETRDFMSNWAKDRGSTLMFRFNGEDYRVSSQGDVLKLTDK